MSTDARTDEECMAAYQGGDATAFRTLATRHHAPVYRFCLRALKNPEAAADAAQEVFLRVVKNAPTWEKRAKFTTWLYTIARNFCVDEARKGRFRKTESLDENVANPRGEATSERKIDRVVSPGAAPDVQVADQMRGTRLHAAIESAVALLPEEQREVFLLREGGDLGFSQIAEITGVGENTVKSRMRYALGTLRRALGDAGFFPEPDVG